MASTEVKAERWGAAWAAMLGVFVLVVAEQLPVGLLTSLSSTLEVTEGLAGLSVTVPSIVAGLAAPVVPLLVGRLDRRVVLVGLMVIMTAANAVSWLAPTFGVLLVSRVFVGIAIGGFWAIGGGLAVSLVSPAKVPRATSIIFAGVAAANVLGVPLGTVLGDALGWRLAFAALGASAVVSLVALLVALPPLTAQAPVRPRLLVAQVRNRTVAVGLVVTLFAVAGHFAAFTFIGPMLRDIVGMSVSSVGPTLLAYGLVGLAGNLVAGALLARGVSRVVVTMLGVITLALGVLPIVGFQPISGIALILLWGLFFGGLSVSMQTWMITAAPKAVEAATALWVAVWNLSIGLGALVGGTAVDHLSLHAMVWIAGGAVLVSFVIGVTRSAALAAIPFRLVRGLYRRDGRRP
ncbi:MFS transporter [Pseudonocardia acaciae]|uniref:MFS transporter n=1 Tax=Pseudonocardia acaciae TaxID=551276 RepID=UPI001FE159BF|nr:MFS transporter [Pseudonocardia acaciae]